MLHILLVSARQEALRFLADGLAADVEVRLEKVGSGADALQRMRTSPPQLTIIDFELPDWEPLRLVQELLRVNAMVNTAVISSLGDKEFHDVSEGLGILVQLPLMPNSGDAVELLRRLRQVLGVVGAKSPP